MKKRVTSGWVLSFSSEEALLQAVRTLVKEEGVFWEVCAPYPCAAVRFANRHAGRAVGAGVRLGGAGGGGGGGPGRLPVLCGSSHDPGQGAGLGQLARVRSPPV